MIDKPENQGKAPKLRRAGKIALMSTVITFFGAIFLAVVAIFIRKRKRKAEPTDRGDR